MRGVAGPAVETVTLLLADVEGSVRHWEADRDAAATAIARLDDLVTEAAGRHGASRPLEQGEGDSFVLAFPSPSEAVACALDLQLSLMKEPWPVGMPLHARMALHSGEVQVREDGRYTGHAFNRCSRLRALAHGGQVLCSRATHDLVVDALPQGASLKDLGEHRLRDLARPERVFQLTHADLPADFPSLRSLSAFPNNLPQQLTSFIGRESEASEIRERLGEARMITLTGAGGCGKTRLALHVAADALDRFPDGVCWVDLAPLTDGALVAEAVAAALSVRELASQDLVDTLARAVGQRSILVILDNCEHLVDACAVLSSSLLRRCSGLAMLATSREPLGVVGETAYRVPSLPVPGVDAVIDRTPSDSVRLFIERARSVRPNLRIEETDAEAIAVICRRLDGIPLAIELAAARTRMLSPAQIADGLGDRFHLLTGGARTALPRQRTLEASVDWSYQLLATDERTLLARLSVFAGSFDLDAAEAVCSDERITRYSVLDLLSSLVDRSLVNVEQEEPQVRYRLLETIRAYARQRLADTVEAADVRTRHLDHYVALAERLEPKLRSTRGLARIDVELDNLRAAMDWGIGSGGHEKVLRLIGAIWLYCWMRGRGSDLERRLQAALDIPGSDTAARAKALTAGEALAFYAGDFPAACAMGEEAVELHLQNDDVAGAARSLIWVSWGWLWRDTPRAREHFEKGITLARRSGERAVEANLIYGLGSQEAQTGTPDQGVRHIEEGLALARQVGDHMTAEHAMFFLGNALILTGRLAEARATIEEQLARARELQDAMFIHNGIVGLAWLALLRGDLESAAEHTEGLRRIVEASAHRVGIANVLWMEAWQLLLHNMPAEAAEVAKQGLAMVREMDYAWGTCLFLWLQGLAALVPGDTAKAMRHLEEGNRVARRVHATDWIGRTAIGLSRVALSQRDLARSESRAHDALAVLAPAQDRMGVTDALELIAAIAVELESAVESARLLGAAAAIRATTGAVRFPSEETAFQVTLAACRVALGNDGFAEAFAEGEGMSMEQAVAYAARGRGERKRPSAGWESLTPAEVEVVRLVAQGLSNPDIAKHLFIARNTVKVHLSHVFAKLGLSSRSELAAEAARRGI